MPIAVREELRNRLQGFRNAEAAYALAVHLARYHAGSRLTEAFTVARRQPCAKGEKPIGGLADVAELGLSEKSIRNAIKTLEHEDVGFLVRAVATGNGRRPRQKTDFGTRYASTKFRFGPDFFPLFQAAKATARRSGRPRTKGPISTNYVGREIDIGPVRSESDQGLPAPLAPQGFPMKPKGPTWASDPERSAAQADLPRLQAERDKPLAGSSAVLNALGRKALRKTAYGTWKSRS